MGSNPASESGTVKISQCQISALLIEVGENLKEISEKELLLPKTSKLTNSKIYHWINFKEGPDKFDRHNPGSKFQDRFGELSVVLGPRVTQGVVYILGYTEQPAPGA